MRWMPLVPGLSLMAAGWSIMWGAVTFWNPLAFTGMWTGAALIMWSLKSQRYPGLRRHLALTVLSVPVWWWFELVNARVKNWRYIFEFDYSTAEYAMLSSIAFSTVVPAVLAAYSVITRVVGDGRRPRPHPFDGLKATPDLLLSSKAAQPPPLHLIQIGSGLILQALVFVFPNQFYPLVWVAPFLVIDGLLSRIRGESLLEQVRAGRWRDVAAIGLAGVICGVLWEFWNFWSSPKWVYSVPLLGFGKVFEMPILGYAGYVPFAWSVVQFVRLVDQGTGGWVLRGPLGPKPGP